MCIADGLENGHQTAPGQNSEPDPEDRREAPSDGEEDDDRPPVIDTYSDISDTEVEGMLLSKAESQSKKSVWEHNNADWVEQQEAREAARKQMALQVCAISNVGPCTLESGRISKVHAKVLQCLVVGCTICCHG